METSLHRQLKALYCGEPGLQEVRIDGFRIDAVADGRLVEIQQGSLGALRDKLRTLLQTHQVIVVKPLAARKTLLRRLRLGGKVVSTRQSPRHETFADIFDDLVHFVGVFPHPNLTLEIVLTVQEEHRVSRKRRRWRGPDYRVIDRLLTGIEGRMSLRDNDDLRRFLPAELPAAFTTHDIARGSSIPRWLAQKMAYCLRKTGAIELAGKQGNALLYRAIADLPAPAPIPKKARRSRKKAA